MTAAGAGGEVTWSSSDVNVATVVPSSGMVTAVGAGTAMITATSGQQTGQASLTVVAPEMALSATSLSFAATAGQTSPPAQTVNISNAAKGVLSGLAGTITFPAGQPSGWLTAALSSTTAPATLTLTANPATLQAGSYTATVAIRSSISGVPEKTVSVTFAVAQGPAIGLSGTTASFNAVAGGENAAVQSINVTNAGGGTLTDLSGVVTYGAGQPSGWLTAALNSTTAPATLTLTARPGELEPGSYTATVTLRSATAGVAETSVNVTFTVAQGAVIGLSTPSVSFSATAGQASPAAQTVQVTNTGQGRLTGLSGVVTYAAGQPTGWLTAALSGTTAPATLTLTANPGELPAGTYNATVTIRSSAAGIEEKAVQVTFTVAPAPAAPTDLKVTGSGGFPLSLTWTDNSSNESEFRIERKSSTGEYSQIAVVESSRTAYFDPSLTTRDTYTYRVRACTAAGVCSAYSNEASARNGTLAITGPAAGITSSSALLTGTVFSFPCGLGYFNYGTTRNVGSQIQARNYTVSCTGWDAMIRGLRGSTTYYYRFSFDARPLSGYTGYGEGDIREFTTLPPVAPSASTNPATGITTTSAVLTTYVDPNGADTQAYYEWGTNSTLSTSTATPQTMISAGAGTFQLLPPVTDTLTGLQPGTTYYFRVVATNSAGTTRGNILSFTTPATQPAPTVTTNGVCCLTLTSATLIGGANPHGAATEGYFEWSTSSTLSTVTTTSPQSLGSGTQGRSFGEPLSGLTAATTYYYRAVATNSGGTTRGGIASFTTPAAGP